MHHYSELAKEALKVYLETGKTIKKPKILSQRKAGVFVTIEDRGELRGCIGTYLPSHDSIEEEIVQNSIAAGTNDNRFERITQSEIPNLTFIVSILSKPERVKGTPDLNPEKYGVIVQGEKTGRRGLLLPNLENVDTPVKQVLICLQKAGIDPREEKLIFYRFEVEKYS